MKALKNILGVVLLTMVIFACKNEAQPEIKTVDTTADVKALNPDATYAKAEFNIEGMTCDIGCAKTIEKKLAKLDGVKSAKVDFANEMAMVEYDEAKLSTESLEACVKKTGETYAVKNMKTVETFSAKKGCADDCTKDCCKGKTEAEKKACKEDCEKKCCAEKKEKA